jgi:alkylation response protein AidB-like acyl-CoA dehydrogenase
MEQARTVDVELAQLIAQTGWIGVTIPAQFGGMGLGHVAKTIILDELSQVSGAAGAICQASQLGAAMLLYYGSLEQKTTWLPLIAAGDCLPTIVVTEFDPGGHVLGMEMTATRDGEEYILNGGKVWIGNSHIGHLHGIVARTSHGNHSKSLSAFLVEADRPGVTLRPHPEMLGLHGFSFGEVTFTNCRIPAGNRIGEEGDGNAVANTSSVTYGRLNLAAVALGIHRAVLNTTVAFAKHRRRYGQPLAELPTIADRIGEIQSRVLETEALIYDAAHQLDESESCDPALFSAKLAGTERLLDSVRDGMEIHGAHGLPATSPIQRYLRDAYCLPPPAGPSAIQRLRLAQHALGETRHWSATQQPV